jgi:hypothetical protein
LDELESQAEANRELRRRLAAIEEEARTSPEHLELLKLRGEVAAARAANERLEAENSDWRRRLMGSEPGWWRLGELTDAGLKTPETAVQTILWAAVNGDLERLAGACASSPNTDEALLRESLQRALERQPFADVESLRILRHGPVTGGETVVHLATFSTGRSVAVTAMEMKMQTGEWKLEPFGGEGIFGVIFPRRTTARLDRLRELY